MQLEESVLLIFRRESQTLLKFSIFSTTNDFFFTCVFLEIQQLTNCQQCTLRIAICVVKSFFMHKFRLLLEMFSFVSHFEGKKYSFSPATSEEDNTQHELGE